MDPLSTAASIIAILTVFSSSTEVAREVWGAPDELQELASELSELNTLTNRLTTLTRDRVFRDIDPHILEAPYAKLRDAQKVFDGLLSKRHGTKATASRFRRRTWIVHRGRIKKVTRDVVTIRNQLSAAMQSLTLSSVLNIRGIQDQHNNALSLIDGRILRYQRFLHSLAKRELTLRLEQTIPGPSSTIDSGTHESQDEAADLNDFLDSVSQISECISETVQFYTPCASLLDCPIETSTACYPEQYFTEYERIAVFSMIELNRTAAARVYKYFLLFARDARHWRRITVTATTTAESRLFAVSSSFMETCYHVLPGLVRPRLEAMLRITPLYDSVTKICIELQLSNTGDVTFDPELSWIIEDVEEAATEETSKHIEEIEQRGLHQYVESEVVILSRIRTHLYLVLVEKQRYIEKKLPFVGTTTSDRKPVDQFIADMKLLQMTQGCPGVAEFVGVVVDDDRTQLCGYLTRLPEQGLLLESLYAARLNDTIIPWERRARWIRQIITAIAEIHKRGVVVGFVDMRVMWLNSDDEIIIMFFNSTTNYVKNRKGSLPPELRRSSAPPALATDQIPDVQSDIFQLGLTVWMLAEHIDSLIGVFCRKSGCQCFPRYRCTADHTNPVELPPCDSEVPAFVNVLVRHCRQERPSQRKPASALLALLPAEYDSVAFFPNKVSLYGGSWINCDECAAIVTDEHYHCSVCNQGDFDLCSQCILKGISCYEDRHKLSRRVFKNGRMIHEMICV